MANQAITASLFLPALPESLSCSELSPFGCFNCTSYFSCHWCISSAEPLGACHALGSPYGCAVGASCLDSADCVRNSPESAGYGTLPIVPVLIFVASCAAFIVLFCAFFYACCFFYERRALKNRLSDARSINLTPLLGDDGNSSHRIIRSVTRLEEEKSPAAVGTTVEIRTAQGALANSFKEEKEWKIENSTLTMTGKRKRSWLQRVCRCCCLGSVVSIFLFACIGVWLFPTIPEYSICSKKIDWSSMFAVLVKNGQLGADLSMLVSVYNPNRFSLTFDRLEGAIFYENSQVGTGVAENLHFDAGAITDFHLQTHVACDPLLAGAMLNEHRKGILLIDVKLKFDTQLWLFNKKITNFNTSYTVSDINPDHQDGRTYCKCK